MSAFQFFHSNLYNLNFCILHFLPIAQPRAGRSVISKIKPVMYVDSGVEQSTHRLFFEEEQI